MAKEPWRVPDHEPEKFQIDRDLDGKPLRSSAHGQVSGTTRALAIIIGMAMLLFGLSLAFPAAGWLDPYLVRAVMIFCIFGGAAAYWSRSSLMRAVKFLGVWVIVIGMISAFYLYRSDFGDRFMASVDPAGVVSSGEGLIVRRNRDGHFWVRARFNGVPVRMMVDTGASNIVLSPDDARSVGLRPNQLDFSSFAETANGSVPFARATVTSVAVGDQTFFDVPVTVNGADMDGSLLGLALLDKFASIEFRGDTLILRP